MRNITLIIVLFYGYLLQSQNCSICPPGTSVQLTSTFPPSATHFWQCTDGFTSTLQNPTFSPNSSTTCNLLVTDAAGCTATSQSIVTVCDCSCNDACVAMNYNSTTDCVTFANTGTNCSPVATDVKEWKNQNTSYVAIPGSNQICDCDIKEYINTSASVTINGSDFRLTINGLQNRCPGCTGSNPRIDFQFPLSGSTTSFPGCAATSDWLTISPATFATNGYVADVYVRYTTPFGVVVNQYRFQYNGGGLNVANVTVTTIAVRSIYKDITARRTVTYTDGCPSETCEILLDIPQQPNDPCANFVAYVSNVNIGAPCSGPGYNAVTINATAPVTYQWYYNGTILSGQTSQFFCLVGQPFGTYCVQINDAAGCSENVCRVYQASCNLTASITAAGNTLTAVLTGCTGTPTYQWQRWNGTAYVNVGTNSSTYNTGGLAGDYRVNVTCSGPPVCNAIANYTFSPPCTADVTITTGTTTLTANVTGCGGTNITYLWERWNGTAWVTVQTITTASTSNVYTPTLSGLYRVTITCNGCSDQAQTSWTAPNPCIGFSAVITGNFNICAGTPYTYNRTITGGTAPFTQTWKIDGFTVGTGTSYTYTTSNAATRTISVTVVDANGCTYTDSKTIVITVCCGMTLSISPTTLSVCTNQNATFTVTPTGGTAPYTYNWTYNLQPSGPVIGAGTGNPKTLNIATAGTYNVVATVTDAQGCQVSIFAVLTVTNCTNCTCTPNLSLTGCVLNGGFTGAGCGNFNYQLQYSATGSGWTAVLSGSASPGGTITHTPTQNGLYRLVIVGNGGSGCTGSETPLVSVNCVPSCNCTAGVLTNNACELSWTNPCAGAGYLADLEYFNGTSWVYVTQTTPYTYTLSGQYRVAYKKAGCTTVLSNVVTVTIPVYTYQYHFDNAFSSYIPPTSGQSIYLQNYICIAPSQTVNGNINWGDATTTTYTQSIPTSTYTHVYNPVNPAGYYVTSTYTGTLGNASHQYHYTYLGPPTIDNYQFFTVRSFSGGCGVSFLSHNSCCVNISIDYRSDLHSVKYGTMISHTLNIGGTNYTATVTPSTYNQPNNNGGGTQPYNSYRFQGNFCIPYTPGVNVPFVLTVNSSSGHTAINSGIIRVN